MRACSREGQVVCFSPWKDFFSEEKYWRVFCGSPTKEDTETKQIGRELTVEWD